MKCREKCEHCADYVSMPSVIYFSELHMLIMM